MQLNVDNEVAVWFRENALARFRENEITLTEGAEAILLLSMSCQLADGMVENVEDLYKRSTTMLERGIDLYLVRHGREDPMNVNRAIHFMVDANEALRKMQAMFPWRQTSPPRQAYSPMGDQGMGIA
jgi:hypothetical protein